MGNVSALAASAAAVLPVIRTRADEISATLAVRKVAGLALAGERARGRLEAALRAC
jgi:hypothetical protein